MKDIDIDIFFAKIGFCRVFLKGRWHLYWRNIEVLDQNECVGFFSPLREWVFRDIATAEGMRWLKLAVKSDARNGFRFEIDTIISGDTFNSPEELSAIRQHVKLELSKMYWLDSRIAA